MVSGGGTNVLTGGSGLDILVGGSGEDELHGGGGNNWLAGGGNDDHLYGGAEADYLSGGDGSDHVYGYGGDDELVANLDNDQDYYEGGEGTDTLVFAYDGGNSEILISAAAQTGVGVVAGTASFGLEIRGALDASGGQGNFGGDTFLDAIELASVQAGSGTDSLRIAQNVAGVDIDYIDLGRQGLGCANAANDNQLDERRQAV